MSEIDLSLSEIISKKKITLQRPARPAPKKATVVKKTITPRPVETKTMPVMQLFTSKNTGDARSRIIARKRSTITDARDQLAQLAKTGDARDKINLKRNPVVAKSGGIPPLAQVAPSKPLDMRQKLDQKRGGAAIQVKKNFNNAQQNGGQQNGSQGKTRMQGNALVRTVSGLTTSAPAAKRSRMAGGGSFVTAPGVTSAVQRQISNRKRPVLQTASGLGGNVIQEFHRSHPISSVPTVVVQQQARPTQVARRRLPQQTLMAAPTTIYREVPAPRGYTHAPRPLMSSGGRLGPLAARPVLVSREPAYAQPTVVYRREPTVIYQDEAPLEYADYEYAEPEEQQQPIYYERSPSPVYQQEEYAEEVYVSRSAPLQQQQYGPAPPPPQPRNLSYSTMEYQPRQQRLQPRPQPQQQQPRYQQQQQQQQQQQPRYQQRPQQQQRPVQQRPVQQRPVQQRPVQQRPVQERIVQQRPVQQQQAVRRAAPVVRQVVSSPKVVGHKVVVSNLHPVATHEDIEELFGNIGHVTSCKMTRPGLATVVFLNLSDAHKSVEVYHNRKLDGQPMQVKIVGTVAESGGLATGGQQQNVRTVRARY